MAQKMSLQKKNPLDFFKILTFILIHKRVLVISNNFTIKFTQMVLVWETQEKEDGQQ